MKSCWAGLLVGFLVAAPDTAASAAEPGYHVIKKISPGGEGGWDYLTVDAEARRLYISRATRVMVIDVDKGTLVGEIPNTPGVHGIALAPKHGHGFISNGGDSTVTVFDLSTMREVARVKVGKRPDAIFYDSATDRVFTCNAGSSDATAIDAATNTVAGTVQLGGRPEFACADGKGMAYVNLEDKSKIVAFDTKELTVKHEWPLAPGEEPAGLAMDREGRHLFSTCHNKKMVVVDADSGQVVATPEIGAGTDAAGFDPEAGMAFSSNGRDGTLTVVKADSKGPFEVVQNLKTAPGARTMAIDAKTHNIYLVTAKPKAGERRRFEPGTFVILVVGK